MNDSDILELGLKLEEGGLSHDAIDTYLAHFGVKGMKWGQRRTKRIQGTLDRTNRLAKGELHGGERVRLALANGQVTQKGAERGLRRGAALQKRVNDGDAAITNVLLKFQGIKIKDLNYHQND